MIDEYRGWNTRTLPCTFPFEFCFQQNNDDPTRPQVDPDAELKMVFPEYAARYKKDMASEREALGSVGFVDDADFAVLDSNGNVESYGRSEDFGSAVRVLAERDRNIQNGHLLTADRHDRDEDAEYQGERNTGSLIFAYL